MSTATKIEWCDATFNPWIGCTKVSPGCAHCYAATLDSQRYSKTLGGGTKVAPVSHWGPGAPRHLTSTWRDPIKWNRQAAPDFAGPHPWFSGPRPRIFCASLADWLDSEVPLAWLSDLLALIRATPHLDWLLLTKRPQNWRSRLQELASTQADIGSQIASEWLSGRPLPNIWVGTTTEDQARADERIPLLLQIPARVRFLSCEPMLGPVDLSSVLRPPSSVVSSPSSGLHWLICGGESGPGARPMHPDWARCLREQCDAAAVAFFFKQWGDWLPLHQEPASTAREGAVIHAAHLFPGGVKSYRVGKVCAGRQLDGIEHNDVPLPAFLTPDSRSPSVVGH